MPDFSKGKIYCIRSHQTDNVYVGSTTQELSMRMCGHRRSYKQFKKNGTEHYVTSFDILEYDDAYIELIEDFPCENKSQLEKREGVFIREMECVNKKVAGRNGKEWREDNKDKINQYQKEYQVANKDKIKEIRKEYQEANKDEINQYKKEWYEANKDKIKEIRKEYYEANKGEIKQYKKEYREANRDRINQKKKERYLKKKQESNSI